jgi:hypothetical protein
VAGATVALGDGGAGGTVAPAVGPCRLIEPGGGL